MLLSEALAVLVLLVLNDREGLQFQSNQSVSMIL
jgi:hypothetical protein